MTSIDIYHDDNKLKLHPHKNNYLDCSVPQGANCFIKVIICWAYVGNLQNKKHHNEFTNFVQ